MNCYRTLNKCFFLLKSVVYCFFLSFSCFACFWLFLVVSACNWLFLPFFTGFYYFDAQSSDSTARNSKYQLLYTNCFPSIITKVFILVVPRACFNLIDYVYFFFYVTILQRAFLLFFCTEFNNFLTECSLIHNCLQKSVRGRCSTRSFTFLQTPSV